MSEDNVEIVRRIYDEWGRGNFRAGAELFDRYTLFVVRPDVPEAGAYRGPEEIGNFMKGFLVAWEKMVVKGEEFVAAGDSVIVAVHQQATGKGSGASVENHYFQVWTFRGGAVVRIENFVNRFEALEAAGLSE